MPETWKRIAYADDVVPNSVFTAEGDIIYGTGAGTYDALHHGSEADVLTLASGIPSWKASVGGGGGDFLVMQVFS